MKNFLRLLIMFCLLTTIFNEEILAQWLPTDRFPSSGGGVLSLTSYGTNVFAGTFNGGVFLTTDSGTSWTEIDSGLTNKSVWSLGVSGSNVFAGTYGGGVFLTTNNGESWTEKNEGLTGTQVYAFAVSGSNIFAATESGVFLSENNGESWTEKNSGLPNGSVRALAVSSSNIFAGVNFSVFLSNNNGESWTEVNSGLPSNLIIYSLAVSENNIFVGINGGGVYLSTNNGTSWEEVNTGLTNNVVWAFAVSGSNVFVGTDDAVFVTTDNGSNWQGTEYNFLSVYALTISEMQLFAGGGLSRVYKRPLSEMITEVDFYPDRIPSAFFLSQNYPNPFNPITKFEFQIANFGLVTLKVYDVLGKEVAILVNEEKSAGYYNVTFDSGNLPSGVYFYRLQAGSLVEAKKMVLMK